MRWRIPFAASKYFLVSCTDTNCPERTLSCYFGKPRIFVRKYAYLFKTPYNYARANVNGICKRRFYFVSLCVEKRGYAARACPLFCFVDNQRVMYSVYVHAAPPGCTYRKNSKYSSRSRAYSRRPKAVCRTSKAPLTVLTKVKSVKCCPSDFMQNLLHKKRRRVSVRRAP